MKDRELPIERLLRLWHLLSLDAPTITGLWAYLLARSGEVRPSPSAMAVLILGTWIVYVVDRLLDTRGCTDPHLLRPRHHFAGRNWKSFLGAGMAVGAVLAWLIFTRLGIEARNEDAVVFSLAMLYFAVVHGSRRNRWLPKELAVAMLIAAATTVPAWSRIPFNDVWEHSQLALAALIFAAIVWLNCFAIERWEGVEARNLPTRAIVIIGLFTLTVATISMKIPLAPVVLSAGTSVLLLFLLDQRRSSLTKMQLRIAADLALLTPLIFLTLVSGPR